MTEAKPLKLRIRNARRMVLAKNGLDTAVIVYIYT